MSFAIGYSSPNSPSSLFHVYRSEKGKSKNTSGENKGLGNGSKCEREIAKPTHSKSMNQISRNYKTGGLNFKYEIWAVSEGYFPTCFQCSGGSSCPGSWSQHLWAGGKAHRSPSSSASKSPQPTRLHCSLSPLFLCGASLLLVSPPSCLEGCLGPGRWESGISVLGVWTLMRERRCFK